MFDLWNTRGYYIAGSPAIDTHLMIDLQPTDNGIVLPVHAQPGARKNGIVGIHAGRLKIAVTQAADKGKANQALVKLLADLLDLNRSHVALLSGETSQHKRFLIAGVDLATLQSKVVALLPTQSKRND